MVKREENGSVSFQIYRKPTHTNQYLNFASHHPLQHKLDVVRTLVDRASSIVTKEEDIDHELNSIHKSLAVCGYDKWTLDTATNKTNAKRHVRNSDSEQQVKGCVTITSGKSEACIKIPWHSGIVTHVKPRNTIRSLLVAPKDKTDKLDKSGAVYGLKCLDCSSSYVGESARPLRTRIY
ncbi:uncharacterized protein [Amphiura filiformis]|uniref:uncharacterized protein n=1 Tax=Amphiura filiformis TaxID=82378 RepID=UPI003B211376